MTDQNPSGLLPCPFCGDRMTVSLGLVQHVVQGACPIGAMSCDESQTERWNTRAHRPVEQEAAAWRVWSVEGEDGLFYHEDIARDAAGETSSVQPLFAASPPSRALSQDEREAVERVATRLPRLDENAGYSVDNGTPRGHNTDLTIKVKDRYWNREFAADLRTLLSILQPEGGARKARLAAAKEPS